MQTPDNITTLEPGQIFVFGSNLAGAHAGGAARYAKDHFGAEEGVGEGLTGNCYAFPTLDATLQKRKRWDLQGSMAKLFVCATKNPDKTFLLHEGRLRHRRLQ
jgi:hypothetical protein